MSEDNFIRFEDGFFVDADYADSFGKLGLTSIDAVFDFQGDENLHKDNMAKHRSRLKFDITDMGKTLFLKRYNRVPKITQLKNWLDRKHKASTADYDRLPGSDLEPVGIATPKTVAYGSQWGSLFEKRSFMVMTEVAGQSLEKKLRSLGYIR